MSDPRNPTKHPELGPGYLGQPVETSTPSTSGSITFNQPASPVSEPEKIIAAAIADGDLMGRRTEQFQQAVVDTEQK